ncbi:MAG: hypothetical protein K1X57_10205 [Gemmataceae bacterium]|nr:hypothetical protein [Gemmataceae bacterium]
MDNRQWLEACGKQLDRHGVPEWHRARLLAEFEIHLDEAGSPADLGDPAEVAQRSAREFEGRRFLQRHPEVRRLAVPSILVALFAGLSLILAPGTAFAGEYIVSARLVDSKAGTTRSAPPIRIVSNQEGVITIQVHHMDCHMEFRLTAKAGNDGESATHTIEFVVTRSGSDGKKEQLCAPRIIVPSDKDASIEIPGLSLHVRVSAVK